MNFFYVKKILFSCSLKLLFILSFSFEFLKDFSHVQLLFFSAVSRVISAVKRIIRTVITSYFCS
jgi:hypothetical protein